MQQPTPHSNNAPTLSGATPRVTLPAPNVDWLMVILVKRWRWILTSTLVAALAVLAALPFLTRQYEISAALLFKVGREQAPPSVTGTAALTMPLKRTEDITTEAEIITSQALIESVVQFFGADYFLARKQPETVWEHIKEAARSVVRTVREAVTEVMILIGLEKRLTPFEKVVAALQGSLTAEAVKRADVVEIKLLFPDQKAGVDVMNKLIELYIAEHIRAFRTPGATEFLLDRVTMLQTELGELEARKRAFSQQSALWDLEEQRRSLLSQLRDLRQAKAKTSEEISRLAAEIEHGSSLISREAPEQRVSRVEQTNPAAQSLQTRIVEQRARLERLRNVYAGDSRRIADEEAELAQLEKLMAANAKPVTQSETFEVSRAVRDTERSLVEYRRRLAGLQAQQQVQQAQDTRLVQELDKLESMTEQARKLARDTALAEQNYQMYARRLEEARISDALDKAEISNVSVIGRPTSSISPVRPRSKLLFLGSLAAGLLGCFGVFVLADALRPTIHSREKAASILGAPVLAKIPEVRA